MQPFNEIFQYIWDNNYLRFLLIAVFSLLAAVIAKLIVNRVLRPLAKKTKTMIDDLFVKSISSIVFYFVLFMGLKMGFQHFKFQSPFAANFIDTLLIVVFMLFILKIIDNYSEHWLKEWKTKTKTTADERLIPLLQKMLKAVVIILAIFFILTTWKVNITPLLTTAGIAGLAIGLAVKDTLANIVGGIQLVLDKTFKVGEKIQLESGEMGIIMDIGLRSTKLKTYDNEIIYIPNGFLANARIKNFTQPDFSIRVNVKFGVVYGSDTDKVRQVVGEAIKAIDVVLEEPEPVVQFLEMSDFSLDFVARVWIQNFDQSYQTQRVMTDEIYKALNKAKIDIPFPTRTLYTKALD